jgi:NhaA family Na+:H+ antiporter
MFPVAAAFGGMFVPAMIFLIFNLNNTSYVNGWAIPMATDIAFALGILALLKSKAPTELKIFLSSLAIVDDIGAVIVIAVFHTNDISFNFLLIALFSCLVLFGLNRLGVRSLWVYALIGIFFVWYPLLQSGVHATVAGVFVAFTIPMRRKANAEKFISKIRLSINHFIENSKNDDLHKLNSGQYHAMEEFKEGCERVSSPAQNLEHSIHNITLYGIMPLFAFANTGIVLSDFSFSDLLGNNLALGIFFGLAIGKVVGITLFVMLFKALKIANIPAGINYKHIVGAGFLAGIGFTMSIFITELAFHGDDLVVMSKLSILIASLVSGILGYIMIRKA